MKMISISSPSTMFSMRSCAVLLLFLTFSDLATAQRNQRNIPARVGRNSTEMKELLDDLSQKTLAATCQIMDGKNKLVLGTVFSSDGWVVTKNSEIKGATDLKCVFGDDTEYAAKVVTSDEKYDLALLKIEVKELVAVTAAEDLGEVEVGQIVVSCDEEGTVMSMGLITAKPRQFRQRERPVDPGRGFLGVSCQPSEKGLLVRSVTESSGAQRAGLKKGDIIVKLSGKKVNTTAMMIGILEEHQPEEIIKLSVSRDEKLLDLEATLGLSPRAQTDRSDKWGGGPFSERRFNFPKVIPHDSVIRPEQCGGPLLNSDGKAVGINIARAFRVASYAVPMRVVKDFVKKGQEAVKEPAVSKSE